jgi:FKBP-type peptidyl-prolyl cis-trans isomerase FklB
MMRAIAIALLCFPAAHAAKSPDFKYQSFYEDWKSLKGTDKADNTAFFSKIKEMAEKGENDVKTLKDKAGKVILYYTVHESGTGTKAPLADTTCDCHYKGATIDGKQFDSSFDRGSPTSFAPNQVIKGWTEAMQQMVEGDMFEMYIPHEHAYGANGMGPIPGGACLVFIMRLEKIKGNSQDRKEL